MSVPGLCRDCQASVDERALRCARCGSGRLVRHPELDTLALAHIDCDAFYASVEKRDNPELADKPVIVGGGRRGVATTACYVARKYGVRSAMPMFKALALCPHAVVIRPDMEKYAAVSREVRAIFRAATPLVEPLSLDEAFLDLTGTEAVHHRTPAATLASLAARVEREVGITVSIGLSYNKFLAKLASEIDKPRGFAAIGRAEARGFLASRSVKVIYGVGEKVAARLEADGIRMIADLQRTEPGQLALRYGALGARLALLAAGEDERAVTPDRPAKSVSAETTFERDLSRLDDLAAVLWPLCEEVAERLKHGELCGRTVVLKLKTAGFRILTRRQSLGRPTQLADAVWKVAKTLLAREATGVRFRLIGVGVGDLAPAAEAVQADLFAAPDARREKVERAIDHVREKFGDKAVTLGRGFRAPARPMPPTGGRRS
ncbi:MAG TPA: DNA polymerase IV [Alphaproteobacteria bacterium]|nr:DNA polymerase IV [Alphaproteobacteria bacterium]